MTSLGPQAGIKHAGNNPLYSMEKRGYQEFTRAELRPGSGAETDTQTPKKQKKRKKKTKPETKRR